MISKNIPRGWFFIGLILLVLIASFAAFEKFTEVSSPNGYVFHLHESEKDVFTAMRRDISGITESRGISFAIDAVLDGVKQGYIDSDQCHSILHIVGHDAYRAVKGDIDAATAAHTGNECIGGYIHGVEAQVMLEGDSVKQKLWQLCEFEKARHIASGPCFHGVGHQAFESTQDVQKSLAVCDSLVGGPEKDLSDCYRGVFSQLKSALQGIDGITDIPIPAYHSPQISLEHPFSFCATLGEKYRYACDTQLSAIFYESRDVAGSMNRCLKSTADSEAQEQCSVIILGTASRPALDNGIFADLADVLNTVPAIFKHVTLEEMYSAYINRSEIEKDPSQWKDLCSRITDTSLRTDCDAMLKKGLSQYRNSSGSQAPLAE